MRLREEGRASTDFLAIATFFGSQLEVRVVDLSTTGCMIEFAGEIPAVGSTLTLNLAGKFDASGQLVWKNETRFGVEFLKPVSLAVIDHIAAIQH